MNKTLYKVLVLDMQPIDPPVGGGRLRLLGLYHNLGSNLPTKYIGTYDWPGEQFRDHYLSDTLREINIPLSAEHFSECQKWQERVGGKTIIDVTFHQMAHLSVDYLEYSRNEVAQADIVIISHPWVYPLIKSELKPEHLLVYDSHNVEAYLRFTLLDDGAFGTDIVREVVKIEYELCHRSDLVLACSQEDRELFNKLYAVPFEKMKIVPNGVFTEKTMPVSASRKEEIKRQLGLEGKQVAIFIGSNYRPNVDAARFIIDVVAPATPGVYFVIAGGVGDGIDKNVTRKVPNIITTGFLNSEEKALYLGASDIAVNPMMSGSGTNIKMFDFMAAGLPILSTMIGARGITESDYAGVILCNKSSFISKINELIDDCGKMRYLGEANRTLVENEYSWEKISPQVGSFLSRLMSEKIKITSTPNSGLNHNRFALMSPWKMRCGIAEYSRHLANALELIGLDILIIANNNPDLHCSYIIDDMDKDIRELWMYDYVHWKYSSIDIEGILRILSHEHISRLNIQYHPGFYDQQLLLDLVKQCIRVNINISVTLHNTKDMSQDTLIEISNLGVKIIVHTIADKNEMNNIGSGNINYIPLGVLELPDQDVSLARTSLNISRSPVIGSFGFLRPHKGVLELIEAVGILKETYPDILLLGVNSLYPALDSEEYLQRCNARIKELSLENHILLITDFLETSQIMRYLHAADIIVLPYHESNEGASATAAISIAARRPLIISGSAIFSSIRDVCYCAKKIEPSELACDIQHVLNNPSLLKQLTSSVSVYAEHNSWKHVAKRYISVFGQEP